MAGRWASKRAMVSVAGSPAAKPGSPSSTRSPTRSPTLTAQMSFGSLEQKVASEARKRDEQWRKQMMAAQHLQRSQQEVKLQDDQARRDIMEHQRLLGLLESPVLDLLNRLGVKDDLSLPLARAGVVKLTHLRGRDPESLAATLGLEAIAKATGRTDLQAYLALTVLQARRDLATTAISDLELPEDAEAITADRERYEREVAKGTHGSRETIAPPSRRVDGPLRKQLTAATHRWYDYLATVPLLGTVLASDVDAAPTWKETVSWALWMLTSRDMGKKHGTVDGWISKRRIETHLQHAKTWLWPTLYPSVRAVPKGEWRLYWARVHKNFESFFTHAGRLRWTEVAVADARAEAVRSGCGAAEQEAAAWEATERVRTMLRTAVPPGRRGTTDEIVSRLYARQQAAANLAARAQEVDGGGARRTDGQRPRLGRPVGSPSTRTPNSRTASYAPSPSSRPASRLAPATPSSLVHNGAAATPHEAGMSRWRQALATLTDGRSTCSERERKLADASTAAAALVEVAKEQAANAAADGQVARRGSIAAAASAAAEIFRQQVRACDVCSHVARYYGPFAA